MKATDARLDGNVIIGELLRNMELGRFEMAYTVLLPCVFTVYLNPDDYAALSGIFELAIDDARRALRARVAELNDQQSHWSLRRKKTQKEYKIACRDWSIEFLPDAEVPAGDVEIHSELNETMQPGYRGTKTTLIEREPSAASHRTTDPPSREPQPRHPQPEDPEPEPARAPETVYAELRYEDDSGPQVFLVMQNELRIGRGGDSQPMDVALYASDEVSREHLIIRRDPASGAFSALDVSTNGTWVDGKRLRKGVSEALPRRAEIGVGQVLTLKFEARI